MDRVKAAVDNGKSYQIQILLFQQLSAVEAVRNIKEIVAYQKKWQPLTKW